MVGASHCAERPGVAELEARVAERDARIAELERELGELRVVVCELRGRLGKNSRNSSKPPSSDGYSKPSAEEPNEHKGRKNKRSLRRRSGRKPGGQDGHAGAHLERVEVPDEQVPHEPGLCEGCGRDLTGAERVCRGESRQVFDLPEEIALRVIEHVAVSRRCQGCGTVSTGRFPEGVRAPVQYGPGLHALGVYLHVFQHLPYDRARQAILDLTGADVSTGTLKAWVDQAAVGLCEFDEQLRALLHKAPVVNFDETGARIAGRLGWIHSASTETLTRYTAHAKRGTEAMDAAGVLPGFTGVAVHDGWKPYRCYEQAIHALCAGHHLRELLAAQEQGQTWALGMSCLLLDTYALVDQAKTAGRTQLTKQACGELDASYRTVIALGYQEHPGLAENADKQMTRTDAQNLLLRLDARQEEALRFAHDFRIPFTNNLAEQDIRMVKLQQKISGCWRTMTGAEHYLTVRSYISTARKQRQRPLAVLAQLAAGQAWMPGPAPG
ncbi:MAG: IS66 family transposase [Solirubrobacteraceae bacterium]|jgi:transposase